jgi:hypothetical protein
MESLYLKMEPLYMPLPWTLRGPGRMIQLPNQLRTNALW